MTLYCREGSHTASERIAFVINSLEGGGAERVMTTLVEYFSHNPETIGGAELHLIVLDVAEDRYPAPDKVHIHRLKGKGGWIQSILALRRALTKIRPRVCVSFLTRANCANILSASLGYSCVISERVNTTSHFGRGPIGFISRSIVRSLYPRADHIVANSKGIEADLIENYRVVPERVSVIANPFDLDRIRRLARHGGGGSVSPPYVVAVGRLTRNKNFRLLVGAFADSRIEMSLVILGEGEQREELLQQVAAAGMSERIHFLGFIDNPFPVVSNAEFFVSASNAEGFPNAIAEAMTLGVPVIATDCPSGPSELLQGSAPAGSGVRMANYGVLVPTEDRASLAEAILRMTDPEVRGLYGAAAKRRMEAFRLDVIAAQYADTIRSAMFYETTD